ncbi:MAG: hypothetical protein M5U31_02725 [Acidimicrobiia bacterium]|nr:hypothetical protein [Acidimicrobiia bacterium]
MRPLLTPDEMSAADAATIAAGTSGEVLMGRAGRAVARRALGLLDGGYGKRCVAVCGAGNNGGDGLIAAEALRRRGVGVDVARLDEGIRFSELDRNLKRADIAIDAMFGTGFHGELSGDAAKVADRLADGPPVLAVDIPSGVHGATGAVEGSAVWAVATLSFAALKPGLVFEPGATHAGEVEVADIGIDVTRATMGVTECADVASWLPPPNPVTNKWTSGVSVVAGSGE